MIYNAAMDPGAFPQRRLRRLRRTPLLRDAVADVTLDAAHLIHPLFVGDLERPRPVASMPGVHQWPVTDAADEVARLAEAGLRQFLLFGVTPAAQKDATGSFAASPEAPVNRLLRTVRERGLDVLLHADLCFCEYTAHGHCGVLPPPPPPEALETAEARRASPPGLAGEGGSVDVDNDATLVKLGEAAVAQAAAGADVVAPSGMMDGQVGAIRRALDAAGYSRVAIMSYSVKYASGLYGPFREAGEGGMAFGDRRGYQMDFRRSREWRSELAQDLSEGADVVMVKPALAYLDIVHRVREACDVPVAAYHVSGEYAMVHAAAERGWVDLESAALEQTYAIRRAGADLIVTYFAPDLVRWLREG